MPPMIILTIVSACYVQFRQNRIIALLLKGMQAGVAAVMINVTITMIKSVVKDKKLLPILMLAVASVAVLAFDVDIILVILVCGVVSGVMS